MTPQPHSKVALMSAREVAEQTLDGTLPYEETWHENARNVLALLDIAEAAANLVGELDEDVKVWGDDHLDESTEYARRATADALSREPKEADRG